MPSPGSSSSSSSRDEATATVTLLQALNQFREAFPQLPDEDFQLSVLAILPPHFEKVVEVWEGACEHFKTLDNLTRLVDGIAHALAVSSGEQAESDSKRADKQADSKEFLMKLNDMLAFGLAKGTKREAPSPELVDLTGDEDEPNVKPNVKTEGGQDLKQIFARENKPLQQVTPRRVSAPATVQLKKARLSLPPPPPLPPASLDQAQPSTSKLVQFSNQVTNMLTGELSSNPWETIDKTPPAKTKVVKQSVNGTRQVSFEIVNEEFNMARRREYFHDYQLYENGPIKLNFRSGPVEAVGYGQLYFVKYGDVSAYHVPKWRTDGLSYKLMHKGLRRPIDPQGFARLLKDVMEQQEPRRLPLEIRLNEFLWVERKQASGTSTDHQ